MANVTVKHILDMVEDHIQDEDNNLWDVRDLLNWYNIGTRTIVRLDPKANSIIEAVKLVSGVKQVIPAGGMLLVGVYRNMGTDGETAGRAITLTSIPSLSSFYPSWSAETSVEAIYNFMPDPNNPTTYYNYPPSDGTGYIEIEFSKVPTIIVYDEDGDWESAQVGIKEGYIDPLINYILYRVYGKDTDIPGNESKSKMYYDLFMGVSGG